MTAMGRIPEEKQYRLLADMQEDAKIHEGYVSESEYWQYHFVRMCKDYRETIVDASAFREDNLKLQCELDRAKGHCGRWSELWHRRDYQLTKARKENKRLQQERDSLIPPELVACTNGYACKNWRLILSLQKAIDAHASVYDKLIADLKYVEQLWATSRCQCNLLNLKIKAIEVRCRSVVKILEESHGLGLAQWLKHAISTLQEIIEYDKSFQ